MYAYINTCMRIATHVCIYQYPFAYINIRTYIIVKLVCLTYTINFKRVIMLTAVMLHMRASSMEIRYVYIVVICLQVVHRYSLSKMPLT